MTLRPWLLAIAIAVCACDRELPPAGQIVLYVDTDAVVPEAPGVQADPSMLSPLVDRVRLEVLRDGKPLSNSTRDVPIDATMLRERRLSFGIVPPPSLTNVSVRVRLFRADRLFGPEPTTGVALDTTFTLPPVASDGIIELSGLLKTDDFGQRLGPVPAALGAPSPSLVGTWRGGRRIQCTGRPRPGEVCVPGAAFFFGNPQFRGRSANDIYEERLVVISPFFLDLTEVTVAAFRESWQSLKGRAIEPVAKPADEYCTWTQAPDIDGDRRALNCITWGTAQAYCQELGKDLPTEAQLEFVASGLGEEWAFPWGNDEPDCSAAVWGCAGIETAALDAIKTGASDCRRDRRGPGPLPPGQGLSDRIGSSVLRNASGDEVQDLGGNVGEWTRDVWARPSDPFWSAGRPLVDPMNTTPNAFDGDAHAARGGDWATTALATRAGFRRLRPVAEQTPLLGFRCARPDRGD